MLNRLAKISKTFKNSAHALFFVAILQTVSPTRKGIADKRGQCTYNVTLRRVLAAIVAVEKQ
jgi:hypothetical protein